MSQLASACGFAQFERVAFLQFKHECAAYLRVYMYRPSMYLRCCWIRMLTTGGSSQCFHLEVVLDVLCMWTMTCL